MRTRNLFGTGLGVAAIALALGGLFAACTMSFDDFEFTGTTATTSEGGSGNSGGGTGNTGNTGGGTGNTGGGTGNTGGATGGGPVGGAPVGGSPCGEATNPPEQVECPSVCNDGCGPGNRGCRIDCLGNDSCTGTVTCPEGHHCTVTCGLDPNEEPGCQELEIVCPSLYRCSVECNGGGPVKDGCDNVSVTCGSGVCGLACAGAGECSTATVDCGANQCSATCTQDQTGLVVNANSSCECTKCGEACD